MWNSGWCRYCWLIWICIKRHSLVESVVVCVVGGLSLVCLILSPSLLCYLCLFQTPSVRLFLSSFSPSVSQCPCLNRALYLSTHTLTHTHRHPHTHTHTEPYQLAVAAVLQMPQCAVISREIWGCYKLCTLNNRRLRISPLYCLLVYMCVQREEV